MIRIAVSIYLPLLVEASWAPWSGWTGGTTQASTTNGIPASPWATTATNDVERIADSNGVFWYHKDVSSSSSSTPEPEPHSTGVGADGAGKVTTNMHAATAVAAAEQQQPAPVVATTTHWYPNTAAASSYMRPVVVVEPDELPQGRGSVFGASVSSMAGTSVAAVEGASSKGWGLGINYMTNSRIFGGGNAVPPAPVPSPPAPVPGGNGNYYNYGEGGKGGKGGKGGGEGGSEGGGEGGYERTSNYMTSGRIFGGGNFVRPAPAPGYTDDVTYGGGEHGYYYGKGGGEGKGKGGGESGYEGAECGYGKGGSKSKGGSEGYGYEGRVNGGYGGSSRIFGGGVPVAPVVDDYYYEPCNGYGGGKSKSKGGKRGRQSYSSYEALTSAGAPPTTMTSIAFTWVSLVALTVGSLCLFR